jgi:PAS domain S-box-containing protein
MEEESHKLPQNFTDRFKKLGSLLGLVLKHHKIAFTSPRLNLTYDIAKDEISPAFNSSDFDFEFQLEQLGTLRFARIETGKNFLILEALIEAFKSQLDSDMELALANSRYETMINLSPFSVQIFTPQGQLKLVNPNWKNIWDISDQQEERRLNDYNILQDPLLKKFGLMPLIEMAFAGEVIHLPVFRYDPKEAGIEGRIRQVEALIYPLKNDSGKIEEIVVIDVDVTEREELLSKIKLERNNLETILKYMPAGVLVLDKATSQFTITNEQMIKIQGRSAQGLIFGKEITLNAFHPDGRPFAYEEFPGIRAIDRGETVIDEPLMVKDPNGKISYLHSSSTPILNPAGEIVASVIVVTDVTKIKKQENIAHFLSRVTSVLIESLNYKETIAKIAEACVPGFADGITINLLSENGIERFLTKHVDPQKQSILLDLDREFPLKLDATRMASRVILTGVSEIVEEVTGETFKMLSEGQIRLISKLGPKSYIAVPVVVRNHIIGSITLLITADRSNFDQDDLQAADELARRVSLALENAQLYEASQKAIALRDEFISIASHELKTPITSMKLQLQLAEKMMHMDSHSEVHINYLKDVLNLSYKQLNRINVLVDDMLDVTRISSGKLQIKIHEHNISELVRKTLLQLNFEIENLPYLLSVEIQRNVYAECDPYRIEQVLTNLLTNAVKYGEGQPIELKLQKNNYEVTLSVTDHGPGIPEEDQERIFKRFERAVSLRHISGLGLGLYISRQIMEQHKGSLAVKSKLNEGSTFCLKFPIRQDLGKAKVDSVQLH